MVITKNVMNNKWIRESCGIVICLEMWDDTEIKDMNYFNGFVQIATNLINTQLQLIEIRLQF